MLSSLDVLGVKIVDARVQCDALVVLHRTYRHAINRTPFHESGRIARQAICQRSSRIFSRMSRLLKSVVARRTMAGRSFEHDDLSLRPDN